MAGRFVGTLGIVLRQLGSEGHLRRVGLACVGSYAKDASDSDAARGQLVYEDEFASLMATLAFAVCAAMLKRCAWMLLGPSAQCVLLLGDQRARYTTIQNIKGDGERFFVTRGVILTNPGANKLYERHVCATFLVQQMMLASHQKEWVCDMEMVDWLSRMRRRVLGTQVVEGGLIGRRGEESLRQHEGARAAHVRCLAHEGGLVVGA